MILNLFITLIMSDRDKLDIALGIKSVDDLSCRVISGTFLDYLPKDIIQYLQQYTGPIDCFYMTEIVYDNQNRRVPQFHAWVNKTHAQATQQAKNKGFYNNQVRAAKIIFIDGQPHLTQPMNKRRLYGMPKPKPQRKYKKRATLNPMIRTLRCSGICVSGKRCKNRTYDSKGKCSIHANQ